MNKKQAYQQLVSVISKKSKKQEQEAQLKSLGMCVCDNYESYRSTIPEGHAVAAMMPMGQCIHCDDLCSTLYVISNFGKDTVTVEAATHNYNSEIQYINSGKRCINVFQSGKFKKLSIDEMIAKYNKQHSELLIVIENGRAQQYIDKMKKFLGR